MPDSFAALPPWAIIAIFAVIGAAAGGAGTYFLRKSYPSAVVLRYLPILAVVAGAALGTLIALPTLRANATPATCEGAQDVAADANAEIAGAAVDPVMSAVGLRVDCSRTEMVFDFTVALNVADVTPEDWEVAGVSFNDGLCGTPVWRRFLDAGWTLQAAYTFQDGTRTLTANCGGTAIGSGVPTVP